MFAGKPVIGIIGGIGSGKSFVARVFGEMGCLVISSDEQVRQVYGDDAVKAELRRWWGGQVLQPNGEINRRFIAEKVFNAPHELKRLEGLIHPLVKEARDAAMKHAAGDPQVLAYVWDTPLLLEASLAGECDAVVFVDAPPELRLARVSATRGWEPAELDRREKLQWGLDKKRRMADYVLSNTADADFVRHQVRELLSRILAGSPSKPTPG